MFAKLAASLNKKIQSPGLKPQYHVHIEQYRGLCALLVFVAHGVIRSDMLVPNFHWPRFVLYLGAGHLSVVIFFCISGYVIGITNGHKKLDVKLYLKKRLVRLYPVYLVSILLSIIVAGGISLLVLTQNLLFLENFFPYWHIVTGVFVNFSVWSLNYEVVYYLFFIALFFARPKLWQLLTVMLVISILMIHCSPGTVFLANYVNGFYLWVLGLLIGWNFWGGDKKENLAVPLLSMLFLHLCLEHLSVGLIILDVLRINTATNFNYIFDIPFCLMVMGILTLKDNVFLRVNKIVCYAMPFFVFLFLVLHHRIFEDARWVMSLIYWALSFVFYREKKISAYLLNKLTIIGKISYALYLFHVPVAELVGRITFIGNPVAEIIIKYLLWIMVTFGLAYFFDVICQPVIKRFFIPAKQA